MKVLQIIDSLRPGGAERMAVNLANELGDKIDGSFLCATRQEGLLKSSISQNVNYLFLKKKGKYDVSALKRLNCFIRENDIDIIHAHSSSFFFGWLIKILNSKIKLIWHDHYGDSENLDRRNSKVLKFCSRRFSGIISVNTLLANWAKKNLHCNNVLFLNNFIVKNQYGISNDLKFSGTYGKRILCVANLTPQKNHNNLLEAFAIIKEIHTDASLHLIGDSNSTHGKNILENLNKLSTEHVFYYGKQKLTTSLYEQSSLGVLTSISEGLPISLLEYGANALPVVITDVGECKTVVNNFGLVVPSRNPRLFAQACISYLDNIEKASFDGLNLQKHIDANYSFNSIFNALIQLYKA